MKRYRLLDDLPLSFLIEGEQQDVILGPRDGFLESDGMTVWLIAPTGSFESITTANVIDIALQQGLIEEA